MTNAQLKPVEEPTGLVVIESVNAAELFADDETLQSLLDDIETDALSIVPDVETVEGRKFIASNAYAVSRCKTTIIDAKKDLTAERRDELKIINQRGAHVEKFLDGVRDRARKELNEWEAEQEAIAQAQADQDALNAAEEEAYHLHDLFLREEKLQEAEAKLEAEQAERDREERERQAEQERKDNDEQIRKETEERLAQEAIENEAYAENDVFDAKAKALEEVRLANQRTQEVEEKAEQDKLDAIEQERIRVATIAAEEEAEQKRLDEIERQRAANVEHQRDINNRIVATFVEHGFTQERAIQAVTLIAQGKIPFTEIRY